MSRFANHCDDLHEDICLLAAGALAPDETAAVEQHLSDCAGCRKYFDELKSITAPLANWEDSFANAQPDQTIKARWASDFSAAIQPDKPRRSAPVLSFPGYCRELFWPSRRIWAGFSAVWLLLLLVNIATYAPVHSMAMNGRQPSPEFVRAYFEDEGLPIDWTKSGENRDAEPPKPTVPRPRSELLLPLLQVRGASGVDICSSREPQWMASDNPKGIAPQSPGLRGTSYPGNVEWSSSQPQRGCDSSPWDGGPALAGGAYASSSEALRPLQFDVPARVFPPEGGTPYPDAHNSACSENRSVFFNSSATSSVT